MASRALIAMFKMALSSWGRSALVSHKPPAVTVSIWMCSPSVDRSRSDILAIISLASSGSGDSGCCRANASSRLVRDAGAVGGRARAVQEALDRKVSALDPALHQLDAADDDAQHVVEVVRDPAGELTDGLHLLRLPQLTFRLSRAR